MVTDAEIDITPTVTSRKSGSSLREGIDPKTPIGFARKATLTISPPSPGDLLPPLPPTPSPSKLYASSPTSRERPFLSTHETHAPPSADNACDKGVQVPPPPPGLRLPPTPTKSAFKFLPKLAPLSQPSEIKFDPVPIPFKSLPLEAAQWTFSSTELQDIVARAIRLSAKESFIRLLPLETLDDKLTAEYQRLESSKAEAQAKYRAHVQRRTTLLQTLNSHNIYSLPSDKEKDGPGFLATIGSLTSQLSETSAACDNLMESLLRIADQQAQIEKLKDLHSSSALAIALRKLNASYGRRTNELQMAKARIQELGLELDDAWRAAENMARQFDDLQSAVVQSDNDDTTEISSLTVESVEVVSAARKRSEQLSNASLRLPRRPNRRESTPPLSLSVLGPPPIPLATKPRAPTAFVETENDVALTPTDGPRYRDRPNSFHQPVQAHSQEYPYPMQMDQPGIPSMWLNADSVKPSDKDHRQHRQSMQSRPSTSHDSPLKNDRLSSKIKRYSGSFW